MESTPEVIATLNFPVNTILTGTNTWTNQLAPLFAFSIGAVVALAILGALAWLVYTGIHDRL